MLLIPFCCQAQIDQWQGNQWLREFERELDSDFLYAQDTKAERVNIKHKYFSRQKNIWLKSGVYTEHLSAGLGKTRLRNVTFGTEKAFKHIFPQEQLTGLKPYEKALPFGIYLGDSFQKISKRLGGITNGLLKQDSNGHQVLTLRDIPPFLGLDVELHFIDEKLQAFELSLDAGLAEAYPQQIANIPTLNHINAEQSLAEVCTIDKKIYTGLIKVLIEKVIDKGLNAKPHRDFYSMNLVSGSGYITSYDNTNMNVIWDYPGLEYPEYLFSKFMHTMNITLNKAFQGAFYDNLLVADYRIKKLSDNNFVFHHPEDKAFNKTISKHLFHAYWDKRNKKIVLSIRYPQTFSSTKPFEPTYKKPQPSSAVTNSSDKKPDNSNSTKTTNSTNKTLTEAEVLANAPRLRKEFAQYPGNQYLMLLGTNADDFVKLRGLHPTFEKQSNQFIIRQLNFWMGSQKKEYKGEAPYGLNNKMKFQQVIKRFPGMNPLNASFDGYTREITHSVKLTEDVHITLKLIFHKEKLQNIIANVNQPLSREWQLLKDKIFF